jgi:uncharacterized protein (TIGR04255 family)
VRFAAPVEPARLEAFQDAIRERYPIKLGRVSLEAEVRVEGQVLQQGVRRSGPDRFLFKDAEQKRTVQARVDGFTFNWLAPYDTWEALRDEAREHWDRYRETFNPEAVTRVALRYINRIPIPLPVGDFADHFRTVPVIAPDLPQGLHALFMRLEIPDPRRGFLGILTETFEQPSGEPARLPFILDIDVIRDATFEPASPSLWETLEHLRDYKNELFYGTITDKTKELFS